MKVLCILFLLLGSIFLEPAYCQFTPSVKEAFDLAFSGENLDEEDFRSVEDALSKNHAYKTIALVQAYSSTENPSLLKKAQDLAETFLETSGRGWEGDFVRIQLSAVLALNGRREKSNNLAETALSETDYQGFSKKEPFVNYMINRLNIGNLGFNTYLQDNLRRQIGSYYLNRDSSEEGPDLQRAYEMFSAISADELRNSFLNDARLKSFEPTIPKKSKNIGSAKNIPRSQILNKNKKSEHFSLKAAQQSASEPTFAKKPQTSDKKTAEPETVEPASDNPFPYWIFIIGGAVVVGLVLVLKRK